MRTPGWDRLGEGLEEDVKTVCEAGVSFIRADSKSLLAPASASSLTGHRSGRGGHC